MIDFRKDDHGNWWFHVIGKGNKSTKISVKDEYVKVWMARYRRFLGMTPSPSLMTLPCCLSPLSGELACQMGTSEVSYMRFSTKPLLA